MTDGSLLERTLSNNLSWNKARIKCLAAFLVALTQTRSVNLIRVAAHFGGRAVPASSYNRIQRFLRGFDLPLLELAHLLIRLMKLTPPFAEMIAEYRRRWQIETLFGCLKSRGFDLEQTHLQESERLEKLLGLLALAICWSWLAGEKLCQSKSITTKKHGRGAKSIFRLGLDHLEQVFRSGLSLTKSKERIAFTLILSCT